MLNSVDPITFVVASVNPVHLAVAVPCIAFVIALIDVASGPCIHAVPPLLVVMIPSLIVIAVPDPSLPDPLSISKPVDKLALEKASIIPVVLAVARRLAVLIFTFVHISVGKPFDSLAMLQAFFELAFVLVPVWECMDPISFWLVVLPLAFIGVPSMAPPHS